MDRRQYLTATAAVVMGGFAGCTEGGTGDSPIGNDPEHSGTTNDSAQHNIDVTAGDTIRVEAENAEGPRTTVTIVDPNGDAVLQERVETESTLTHAAESDGVFRVIINSTGTSTYEIYVDEGE